MNTNNIISPCIGVCKTDTLTDYCYGCGRNTGDKLQWKSIETTNEWKINNLEIPYRISSRRKGDIASSYADPTKANSVLGWKASRTLEDMCYSAWNFQKNK